MFVFMMDKFDKTANSSLYYLYEDKRKEEKTNENKNRNEWTNEAFRAIEY